MCASGAEGAVGGGGDFAARAREQVLDAFRVEKLERDFQRDVKGLEPRWQEVFRSLETGGEAWTQVAFPGKNAIAWRTEDAGSRYVLRGQVGGR